MNASISALFSPTIKSERDKWLRFVHTHRAIELQLERKVCDGCQSISLWNVFRRLISGSIPATWMIEPGKQTTTPQGKPLFLSFSIVPAVKLSFS